MQQQYPDPSASPYRAPYAVARPTNSLAVVSLVASIAGWVMLPIVGPVVGVVCGHMARRQIRETGEDGDGLAMGGLVLGYASLAMTCVGFAIVGALIALGMGAVLLGQ